MNANMLSRAALAALTLAMLAPTADAARHGHRRPIAPRVCTVAAPVAAPVAVPVPAPAATAANTYQSFSYEPAAVPQGQPTAVPVIRSMSVRGTSSMQQNAAAYGKIR